MSHPTDRSVLIRLASSLPVGSDDRRTILAGLEKTKTAYLTGEADYFFGWAKDLCWYIADALRSTPMRTTLPAHPMERKVARSAVAGNGREKGGEQGESVAPSYENHIYLWDKAGNKYTLRFYSYITRNPDTFKISMDGGQEAGTSIGVDVNQYDSPRVAWTALRRAIAKASSFKRLRPYSRTGPHVEIK